uniref:Protein takeout n=1 Tax=Rhodnius prolixus TaxID=13249 RepID=T1HEQ7_RHOPR
MKSLMFSTSFNPKSQKYPRLGKYLLLQHALPRCSRNDPELNKCMLKAAKDSVPIITKGVPKLDLPRLDPLLIKNYSMGVHKIPINLDFSLQNAQILGPGNISITTVNFDKKIFKMNMEGFHKQLKVLGNYNLKGKLFLIPIDSKEEMQATHTVLLTPKTTKGATYLDIKLKFKINKLNLLKINMNNPSASQKGGQALNKLVNDNWKLLFKAFTPRIETMVETIFTKAFQPMFTKFTYNDLLPEKI